MRKEFKSLRNFLVCQHDCHFIVLEHQIATVTLHEPGGGGTPIHYLYRYVPPNRVVILKLLI